VGTGFEGDLTVSDETYVSFVDESSSLQRVAGLFAAHHPAGDGVELCIDFAQQWLLGTAVSLGELVQVRRDVGHL
jgi:hypothetical protein